ncbi:hypothetical protein DL764_009911 [Monosporascus ibericus]|uniref:Cytochrome P450 n=1 Tax=Monosporascus ibericus TaxID=155417 RepID=A0A4V1X8U7_9PEZI|nr:hypothetical protein DL764_009911 [Monosporascus ibericus]
MGFGEALPGSSRVSTSTGIVTTWVALSLLLVYFWRASFYNTLQAYNPNGGALPAVFNTTDDNMHKLLKTPIAPLFTPANAPAYEGHVNEVLAVLEQKLDSKFLNNHEIFNLGEWLQFFAFDVMGTLTFSRRYGFLENGKDVNGMLSTIVDFMRKSAPVPQLDWLLRKNRVGDWFQRTFVSQPSLSILLFIAKAIKEKKEKPSKAPTTWTFSNVIAGSDSVGTVMRTTMFNLLRYPNTLQKLYQELVDADVSGPYPKYSEVRNLPYLDACIQEAIRMHPPFALPFERVVPKGGVSILGRHIPEGTDLGGNPYVVNRHKGTFGGDAEFWRPERWLEKDEAHKRKLEQSVLTFGAGRRVCIGRHIGILEVKKIISFLVLTYDIHIVDPARFQVENSWFFFQKGLYATIRKRPEATTHMDRKGA